MAENVIYKREEVKIGTAESLNYTSYQKYVTALRTCQLSRAENCLDPRAYAKPDSGFLFRFPFPDEDHLPFGQLGDQEYFRSLPINISSELMTKLMDDNQPHQAGTIKLSHQKFVHALDDGKEMLAIVVRVPELSQPIRIEDKESIRLLGDEIIMLNARAGKTMQEHNDLVTVAERVLAGYGLRLPNRKLEKEQAIKKANAKKNRLVKSNFLKDRVVMVAPDLTTDPLSKQAEIGRIIKADLKTDTAQVRFSDGKQGAYSLDALLTLLPLPMIEQGLKSNFYTFSMQERQAYINVINAVSRNRHADALMAAKESPDILLFSTTNAQSWNEMQRSRQYEKLKAERKKGI